MAEKEVLYSKYCSSCKYWDLDEAEDPCNECLNHPSNTDSHRPIHWKEKDGRAKTIKRRSNRKA